MEWNKVSHPIGQKDALPAERKVVAVWLENKFLPYCGYIRYSAGEKDSPFFVVYHGNSEIGARVIAWCECLPLIQPEGTGDFYAKDQKDGRGYPARNETGNFKRPRKKVKGT